MTTTSTKSGEAIVRGRDTASAFDHDEERWFARPRTTKRPSERPRPAWTGERLGDPIADAWFRGT